MTSRTDVTNHLEQNGCYSETEHDTEAGSWYVNCINAESVLVPIEDGISDTTYSQIVYELKIQAPFELESFYEVYKLDREASSVRITDEDAEKINS